MKDKRSILGEIKAILFGAEEMKSFKEAKSGDYILRVEGEDFAEGMEISLVTEDGLIPVEDGAYPLEDGRELVVAAGKIEKIEGEVKEEEEEGPEIEIELAETELLDGTKVKVEGDVAVGNKVLVEKDGEFVQAPEGQHNLADGKVIYVDAEGLINEIQTPDTKKEDEVALEVAVEAPAWSVPAALTAALILFTTNPFKVVVLVAPDTAEPILIAVVEPDTPAVPMFNVLVEPDAVAPA